MHTLASCHYLWGREEPTAFLPRVLFSETSKVCSCHRPLELFWKLGLIARRVPEPSEPPLGLVLSQRSAGLGPRERRGPCWGDRQGQHHRLSSWDHVGDPQETLMTRRCLGPRAALVCKLPHGFWLDLGHLMSKETATTSCPLPSRTGVAPSVKHTYSGSPITPGTCVSTVIPSDTA